LINSSKKAKTSTISGAIIVAIPRKTNLKHEHTFIEKTMTTSSPVTIVQNPQLSGNSYKNLTMRNTELMRWSDTVQARLEITTTKNQETTTITTTNNQQK
jgi:hypothetical protein